MRAAVVLMLGLVVGLAEAETPEHAARAHYIEGKRLYDAGQYREALREFEAGYKASPRREFLINLGQAHRRLDELAKAREMYLRFLAEAPGDDPLRPQVIELIAEIDRAEQAGRLARVPPPQVAARTVAERPEAQPETSPPRSRRMWLYGGAGVALIAGVVAIVVLTSRGQVACSAAELGCIDRR